MLGDAFAGSSSSGNLNSVSVVLTRDPERKRRLYELHFEQPMVLEAPLVATFCADWFRTREWLRRRGARDNFNNLIGYHVAAFDAMIVAQNACLGFQAHDLGICYMGTTLHSMTEIAAFLELPDTCVPVTTIVVGWPDEDPAKRDRLPLSAMVHEERYRRPADDELEATYAQRELRGWAALHVGSRDQDAHRGDGNHLARAVLHEQGQVRSGRVPAGLGAARGAARGEAFPALEK